MSLTIQTSDGQLFAVKRSEAEQCTVIKYVLMDTEDENDVIPLPQVNSDTWRIIQKYLEKYDQDHDLLEFDNESLIDILQWEREYITDKHKKLSDLSNAANYLQHKRLTKVCIQIMAEEVLKMRDTDERLAYLGLHEVNYTPEESREVCELLNWANEPCPCKPEECERKTKTGEESAVKVT